MLIVLMIIYFTDVNSCYGQCQNGGTCQVGIFLFYLASLFRHCGLNQLHSFCALNFGKETCILFINHPQSGLFRHNVLHWGQHSVHRICAHLHCYLIYII